jgi:cytochrome c oxidase subunit 3
MHTKVVRRGLIIGFFLFLASEIMLFWGFFWAFLHSSLSPSFLIGGI